MCYEWVGNREPLSNNMVASRTKKVTFKKEKMLGKIIDYQHNLKVPKLLSWLESGVHLMGPEDVSWLFILKMGVILLVCLCCN